MPYPEQYAIAVRMPDGLWQRYTINLSDQGDVYFNFLGSRPRYKPHISYQESGALHNKLLGQKVWARSAQPPGKQFKGTATEWTHSSRPTPTPRSSRSSYYALDAHPRISAQVRVNLSNEQVLERRLRCHSIEEHWGARPIYNQRSSRRA
jgi:hypothetical protein